jgi:hypothetical protein
MQVSCYPHNHRLSYECIDGQEVKHYKEEWDSVMDKVETIASLVGKFSTFCKEHNLKEEDIPHGLRDIFEKLVMYVMRS